MKKDLDPRVRRWLEMNDPVQGVFDTVEMSAHLSLDEKGDVLDCVCRAAAQILEDRPDRAEVLARQAPLSPESEALWRRLVARGRAARAERRP